MKYVADLNAAPKITVPNGITVTPASGQRINLENPVTYTLSTKITTRNLDGNGGTGTGNKYRRRVLFE